MRRRGRHIVVALLALLCFSGVQPAQARRDGLTPIVIRVTGYLGEKRDTPILLTSWKVNRGRSVYHWHVIKLEVLSGNIAYFNIVSQLEPYDPAFSIAGDTKGINAFINTPPGETIVVIGYLRLEAAIRTLMIDTVTTLPSETPTPG
jgi:hypothetical protein